MQKRFLVFWLVLPGLLFLLMGAGMAQANLLTNGSFEQGAANINPFLTVAAVNNTAITGWTVATGNIDYIGNYWVAEDGSRSLDLSGGSAGSIEQSFATIPGAQYQVSFWLAGNPAGGPTVKTLNVLAPGVNQQFQFDTTGRSLSNMGWVQESFTFTASAASSTLDFISLNNTAYGPALDNVVVEGGAPIPLPSGFFLLGSGLVSLGFLRRKWCLK